MIVNDAVTVQSTVTGRVVKVLAESVPPRLPPTDAECQGRRDIRSRWIRAGTICGELGEMVPLAPALGVTVRVTSAKVAATVQSTVAGRVV